MPDKDKFATTVELPAEDLGEVLKIINAQPDDGGDHHTMGSSSKVENFV